MAAPVTGIGEPPVHAGCGTNPQQHDLPLLFGHTLPHLHRGVGSAHDRFGDRIADVAQLVCDLVCCRLPLVQRLA